jgi:hypothetical protein
MTNQQNPLVAIRIASFLSKRQMRINYLDRISDKPIEKMIKIEGAIQAPLASAIVTEVNDISSRA